MPFHLCVSGSGCFLSSSDSYDCCLACLGHEHFETAFVDGSCYQCKNMTMSTLWSKLFFFMKARVPSAVTQPTASAQSRAVNLEDTLGDLRVTVGAFPLGQSPRTSHSSSVSCAIELPDDGAGPSHGGPSVSFCLPSEDQCR